MINPTRGGEELPSGLSVVVAVHDAEETLDELQRRIGSAVQRVANVFELIFVDDHSKDDSWDRIVALASAHEWIRGIRLAWNAGQHAATLCGINAARYDITVTLDDDLQHPPEAIGDLLAHLDDRCLLVYGIPVQSRQPWYHRLPAWCGKSLVAWASGSTSVYAWSGFRAFRTLLRSHLAEVRGETIIDAELSLVNTHWQAQSYEMSPRFLGRTRYAWRTRFAQVATALATVSTRPLRWLGSAALLVAALVFAGVFVLLLYHLGGSAPPGGWDRWVAVLAPAAALWGLIQCAWSALAVIYFHRLIERDRGPVYTVSTHTPVATGQGDKIPRIEVHN